MTTAHLPEEMLQEHAFGHEVFNRQQLMHLENCAHCKQAVIGYTTLFNAIEALPAASFDIDMTEAVLAQLPAGKQIKPIKNEQFVFFALLGIVPLIIFKRNIQAMLTQSPGLYLLASIAICLPILVYKVIRLVQSYKKQIAQINFAK